MKLFDKPRWLRPEVDQPRYWLHILVIVVSLEFMIALFGAMVYPSLISFGVSFPKLLFSWFTIILGLMIGASDIISHSLLGLD